jgi:hypothetical protein
MNLFRRKNVIDLQAEALSDHSLKRALGPMNLTALGVGAIIGTGIFVLTGTVAAQNAGPAVVLSFVLAGVASVFAALCYSEFASLVPMAAGSVDRLNEIPERVVEVAFHEGAHPRKGFEMILVNLGICRAITWFGSIRDSRNRAECLRILVRSLYREIAAALKRTVASAENAEPQTENREAQPENRNQPTLRPPQREEVKPAPPVSTCSPRCPRAHPEHQSIGPMPR